MTTVKDNATGGREIVVHNPVDGSVVGAVTVADERAVGAVVTRVRRAQDEWRRVPAAERGSRLHDVAAAMEERRSELAQLTSREMGKPLAGARDGVDAAIATVRQYAELGPVRRGDALLGGWEATDLVVPEPRGVVAAITPWNDPVAVPAGIVAAAVVTGNAVILKPSERSPHTGRAVAECFASALPPDVVVGIDGDGTTGAALASNPGVDVIVHVGSSATGRRIAEAAARTGAKALLENGGKDPLIVDADVDPSWAAQQAALGAFANAGQICTSVERIYVVEGRHEEFLAALAAAAESEAVGDPCDPRTTMGPLVDRRHRDQVHGQVRDAVRDGAVALTGGDIPPGPGAFYPPTVLAGCTEGMRVMREETFGPVAPVVVVPDFETALERAGDSSYGLAASVLTRSMRHAQQAARRLPVGTVKINNVFGGAPGGSAEPRRSSGRGLGYGPELLDELTARKVVHITALPDGD